MFFCSAQRSGGSFIETWKPVIVAFDVTRRYLYCSAALSSPSSNTRPEQLQWKSKLKLRQAVGACSHLTLNIQENRVKERQFYEVEILGEKRPMVKNEIPPPEPLLCPSSGLAGTPERFRLDNEEFIRDPFFLKELHEALLNTFVNLRLAREPNGITSSPNGDVFHTIDSPKVRQGWCGLSFSAAAKVDATDELLRFQNFYEYRRFMFVVLTVLSHDKLMPPPHMGYPPYDPRNGVVLSPLPLYLWRWYHELERQALYFCGPGDLIRKVNSSRHSKDGKGVRGGHLCVLDTKVFFLHGSDGDRKPYIVAISDLHQIRRVYFNSGESPPCVILMGDADGDILFMPQRQRMGALLENVFPPAALGMTEAEAATSTSFDCPSLLWATREVLHIVSIIRDLCLSSIETHPVIPVECIEASTVSEFVQEVKRRAGRGLRSNYSRQNTPQTKTVPAIWAEFRERVRELRNLSNGSSVATGATAAVPIYENHTNNIPLTVEQLREMQSAVEQDRRRRRGVRRGDFQGQGGIIGFTLEGIAEESARQQISRTESSVQIRNPASSQNPLACPWTNVSPTSSRSSSLSLDSSPSYVDQEAVYFTQAPASCHVHMDE